MVEDVKKLVGEDCATDEVIELVYEMMCQYVRNYCRISEIPEGLQPVLTAMAAGYLWQVQRGEKKVTLGDTTVEYFSATEKTGQLTDYHSQLNRYRRLFPDDT